MYKEAAVLPSAAADKRQMGLQRWLADLGRHYDSLVPISGDASFRRYFRLTQGRMSWIAMDAPPERESSAEFVDIANKLQAMGVNAPQVVSVDLQRGYLLLADLGGQHYLDALSPLSADKLYAAAMDTLERLQLGGGELAGQLPLYDEPLLQREMALFPEWLLSRHLQLEVDAGLDALLQECFAELTRSALEQPRVCVHRDYHSRNLMVVPGAPPGVLDFQDAVYGPITYDLVSLLKDAYIAWPQDQVTAWAQAYRTRPALRGLTGDVSAEQWQRWFDLMGLQRHLKVAGIFARLWYRDGKGGYLKDIPRTVHYMVEVTARYGEFSGLHRLLTDQVLPGLGQA